MHRSTIIIRIFKITNLQFLVIMLTELKVQSKKIKDIQRIRKMIKSKERKQEKLKKVYH